MFCHVDGMRGKPVPEFSKNGGGFDSLEVQKEQGAGEEDDDLQGGDEPVGVISGLFQPILDPAQLLDDVNGRLSVHVVFPPAGGHQGGGDQEQAHHQEDSFHFI